MLFADLVANNATHCCVINCTSSADPFQYRASHCANARTYGGAFAAIGHGAATA
jgi:hypothetical protein